MGIERLDRRHGERSPHPDGSPFVRDRARIRQSAAFQRLRHVTQVMAVGEPGHYHNRLTHSLAVARIGRAMADALLTRPDAPVWARHAVSILDPTVVEAACLAHDLGHPPFAHVAEAELDRLLTAAGVADGFEANAQTFRVVCSLPNDATGQPGLNLTRATLAAILKYPWLRNGSPEQPRKWGAYASEAADFAWARAHLPPSDDKPTLEAQVMDWADLVAYAALDFEDFVRTGAIPLVPLRGDAAERTRFLALVFARRRVPEDEQELYAASLTQLLASCPATPQSPSSRTGRNTLRCFIKHEIDRAIGGISLALGTDSPPTLEIDPAVLRCILLLEGLTWHYVIDSELLVPQRDEQRKIIRDLFEALGEAANAGQEYKLLPRLYREHLESAEKEREQLRMASDYLASLTEAEAVTLRQRLTG